VAGEPWAPGVSDVARHVPTRTRDTKSPGSDKLLNTFNANTTPDDSTVQQMIDDTVAVLEAQFGDMPSVALQHPDAAVALREYVSWRVAADIELAYPNRDADLNTADRLDARARAQLEVITAVLTVADIGAEAVLPVGNFPMEPAYADVSPGAGTERLMGRFGPFGGWPFIG
jgi:hypothetical protein